MPVPGLIRFVQQIVPADRPFDAEAYRAEQLARIDAAKIPEAGKARARAVVNDVADRLARWPALSRFPRT